MSKVWLVGVAAFVALLVVVGLVVALVTTRDEELLPADSPEGVVQRFLRALEADEYVTARGYLDAATQRRCSLDELVKYASYRDFRDSQVTLRNTERFDSRAIITAEVTVFDPNPPFDTSEYSYRQTFELLLVGGEWRISGPEYGCPPLY